MKIAIPVNRGELCMHFGHCEEFALVDVDQNSKTIRQTEYRHPPAHEPGVLPIWLHQQGVDVIISSGMGNRARFLFEEHDIHVIVGASDRNIESLAMAYLNETLKTGANVCDH